MGRAGGEGTSDVERVVLFNLLHLAVSGYALLRGGAPERVAGIALLIATLSTRLVQSQMSLRFAGVEWGVFCVDLGLLAVLLGIAMDADRYWPLWVTALHGLGTFGHVVRLLDVDVLRPAYAVLTAVWSYPILLLLVGGTARHQVRRSRRGEDSAWSRRLTSGRPWRKEDDLTAVAIPRVRRRAAGRPASDR